MLDLGVHSKVKRVATAVGKMMMQARRAADANRSDGAPVPRRGCHWRVIGCQTKGTITLQHQAIAAIG